MKKVTVGIAAAALCLFAVLAICAAGGGSGAQADYLRIHIRANSNDEADQNVKYAVKDAVVKALTPLLGHATDKRKAMEILERELPLVMRTADETLAAHGFAYRSRASVRQEDFPTRSYGDLTLESGVYDALIVELGEGTGNNWWCVVFPPLCFTAAGGADEKPVYRSLIKEWLEKIAR